MENRTARFVREGFAHAISIVETFDDSQAAAASHFY
jgi:hypothetical protein